MREIRVGQPAVGRTLLAFIAVASFFAISPAARAQEYAFTFDPAATQVDFTLAATLHTVHGTMNLKNGQIRFDPSTGTASGRVIVDATSAETGNKSRDRKMHKQILRSALYPRVVFTARHVSGAIRPTGASHVELSGAFELEGHDHPMTLFVSVTRAGAGARVQATTKFAVPYEQWGLKNPNTFILRVSNHVEMIINATGQLTTIH
ncbi:MAG: YceI family protein [Candidatus Acidiferrales bacterium]